MTHRHQSPIMTMKPRSAINTDRFADEPHRRKIDTLVQIEPRIDCAALAAEGGRVAPRPASAQGGRPAYPTGTMVRLAALRRLYHLPDGQMAYRLPDRVSYRRFRGLARATNVPDRTHGTDLREPARRSGGEGPVRWGLGAVARSGPHRARRSDQRRDRGAGAQTARAANCCAPPVRHGRALRRP